ncbi:MAG: cytochrome c assembly protein, partial [Bacteroidetes bacterium]
MNDSIQYLNEHLLPGYLGRGAIFLAFTSALLSTYAYFRATRTKEQSWRQLGRGAFVVHGFSVLITIGTIFYVMVNQYYEYQYVNAHVNADLPFRYIFSAFWEGQEGSFLLWMFWHVVLGGLLMGSVREWESPVLTILASIQVVLMSMILGVYVGFGDHMYKLGSNPMLLLRDTVDAPIFANPDYVSLLVGTGLNPLLQNWWMTIHPPTLFLGFASTSVPFAFALAGLWTGRHREWLKPALPWALFSGAILGTGILMGGAWAYEALSFGGYWAWDPVENMSLVPWLTLVAGIHTNLVARNSDHSIRATYAFYLLTFILIVYSTFLTRSGVLGETSVHAFTEMGLEWQLVFFIVFYALLSMMMYWRARKYIPNPPKEEPITSKEFWMFIGSLILLFSAILITASTSLPVYNKIASWFDPGYVGKVITDPIPHYNKYQLWIAVFIGLLSGFSQFLRFREMNFAKHRRQFWLHTLIGLSAAAMLTFGTAQLIELYNWQYSLLAFTSWFTVVTNLDYLISFLRLKMKAAGSVLAHVGFGLMIIGVLFSGLNKNVISHNPFLMEGLTEDEDAKRNTVLLIEGSPMLMDDYEVTLMGDTLDHLTRTYRLDFKRKDARGQVVEEFELFPNILYTKDFDKVAAANPSTRHYLTRDIFTHIA